MSTVRAIRNASFPRVPKRPCLVALVFGLIGSAFACSSSDDGGGSPATAGSTAAGSAGLGQAGSPAAGSGGSSAGASSAGAGGLAAAGSSASGAGGSSAGSAGSSAGGGGASTCSGQAGTTPVGDKSVRDGKTCLTWTKTRATAQMTNKVAAKYCASLEQDGISDWRVPTPEELVTWPALTTDGTAYITGPVYIPTASTDQDGCTGNSHSCNIAKYNDTSLTCAWQGVGFSGWVACVSGTPTAGSTQAAYTAAMCSPCSGSVGGFKVTDCSAFAN